MMNLKRRLFLRGLGGAAVAAPFLSSVAERAAKAQGTTLDAPKRLIAMFTHYGCVTERWFPENSHGALSATDFEGTNLESLAGHADKILLPRGIRAMNQWNAYLDFGQGNDSHTQVCGTYFTCVPVTPHSEEAFDFDEEKKFNAMPTAPSLDHVCARQVSPGGEPLFMRVGGRSESPQSAVSYSAGLKIYDGFGSLMDVYSSLTGLFVDGSSASPDDYQVARGQSLLDLVKDDLETLERFDMSQSDKQKLAAWKELLHSTTNVMRSAQCSSEMVEQLALTEGEISFEEGFNDISAEIADGLDGADLYSNMAVLSAICDANRVIFLKYPGNYNFKGLGIDEENHSLSHRISGGVGMPGICSTNVYDLLETIDRFYAEKFAHLIARLDEIEEGDATLLDNCAAVWFQEMSDGNTHNLNNMPIIQAGACDGYFKTGQAVNVDDGSSDLHRGTSYGPCASGDSEATTGTPEEFGNAPINKYYCNLMNAIGVKADETGFPTEGSDQEVTHYGMYDDTTDFASGGANPPKINSPGAFSELKANS